MYVNDWSFLLVIATILLTPGPTNTLLASSGISQGLRRSAPLLSFECLGYVCATSIWGLVLNTTMHDYPFVINIIKVVSGLYIAKLGWRLWHQARLDPLQELMASVSHFAVTVVEKSRRTGYSWAAGAIAALTAAAARASMVRWCRSTPR